MKLSALRSSSEDDELNASGVIEAGKDKLIKSAGVSCSGKCYSKSTFSEIRRMMVL